MASNKKVITLGMDYSQLDAGAAEINRKMGLLEAQFKLAKEQVVSYGNETDQLNLKQDKLTQQIILQTKKVEASKQAYDKAIESGKATDKQLDNLNKAYIDSQTKLQKLNNELNENKTKIDSATKSTASFGDLIRSTASTLGINVSPAIENLASKFDGVNESVGTSIMVVGAVATALIGCTVKAAETADKLLELSSVTSITTDELQKMQYASGLLDVDVSAMTDSMGKLTRSMSSARDGSKEMQSAFKELHVRYQDTNGVLLDSQTIFYNTIDALGKVKNETERDALAMTVFGKSARELNPLIEAGSLKLKQLGIEAEDMGLILSESALQDLGQFDDEMYKFNQTVQASKTQLGLVLLPILTDLAEVFAKIPAPVLVGIAVFAGLSAILMSLAKTVTTFTAAQAMLAAANVTVGETGMIASVGMGPLLLILLAIAAVIAVIVGGAVSLKNALREAQEAGNSAINSASGVAQSIQNTQVSTRSAVGYANGTRYAVGGEAWVGEEGPEKIYVPRGSQVLTNSESRQSGGNTNIYVTVPVEDLREINDVVTWANGLKQKHRAGAINLG